MAVAFVQGALNSSGSAVTLGAPGGAGHALCVSVFITSGTGGTVTITDDATGGSNTYSAPSSGASIASGGNASFQFYATNIHGSPSNITGAATSGNVLAIVVAEFSGVATSTPSDGGAAGANAAAGSGTDAVTSGSFTPTANGDAIWAIDWDNTTIAPGTGFTQDQYDSGNGIMSEYMIQTTAAPVAGTFTHASTQAVWVQAQALKSAAGGGGATFALGGQSLIFM